MANYSSKTKLMCSNSAKLSGELSSRAPSTGGWMNRESLAPRGVHKRGVTQDRLAVGSTRHRRCGHSCPISSRGGCAPEPRHGRRSHSTERLLRLESNKPERAERGKEHADEGGLGYDTEKISESKSSHLQGKEKKTLKLGKSWSILLLKTLKNEFCVIWATTNGPTQRPHMCITRRKENRVHGNTLAKTDVFGGVKSLWERRTQQNMTDDKQAEVRGDAQKESRQNLK